MLLENITAATLPIQVKTFSFEVVVENSFPHFSLPFGFYCHYCKPQWHTAAGWPPPKLDAPSTYMFSSFSFWAAVIVPPFFLCRVLHWGDSSCILKWSWSSYQLKTVLIYLLKLSQTVECWVLLTPKKTLCHTLLPCTIELEQNKSSV